MYRLNIQLRDQVNASKCLPTELCCIIAEYAYRDESEILVYISSNNHLPIFTFREYTGQRMCFQIEQIRVRQIAKTWILGDHFSRLCFPCLQVFVTLGEV